MPHQAELDQLEAERVRLQSMIDYHAYAIGYPESRTPTAVPLWITVLCVGALLFLAWVFVSGVIAGEYSLSNVLIGIVILTLLAFFGMRKIVVFGIPIRLFELVFLIPNGETAGEPQIRQRLDDCETRIKKLKERHS